jgi:hypothetical protein
MAAIAGAAGAVTNRSMISATVLYRFQPCSGAAGRLGLPKPVTAGTLELRRGGKTARVSLVDGGTRPAGVSLPGQGPVKATLVLQTPRVRVTGPAGSAADRISLGARPAVGGRLFFSVGNDEERNGRVNTLIQLQRAARVAAVAAPRQLPPVIAHVHDKPQIGFDPPNAIEVGEKDGLEARWEPTALIHEYGHFVLYTIARDGPDSNDDHQVNKSYPSRPNLAWSEGFPNAFAGLVQKESGGLLVSGCRPYINLASLPRLASREDERHSQYNEARVGAATYQLVQRHLGGAERGLKRLLNALTTYRRAGHPVWTTRDLRDLAAQKLEQSAADQTAIDQIFFGQQISWTANINVGISPQPDLEFAKLRYARATIQVRVTGPGGFDCRTSADIEPVPGTTYDGGQRALGTKKADGGLSFSGADDCYLVSAGPGPIDFGKNARALGFDQVTIPFPYLAGGQHWSGAYTVHAKYHCEFEPSAPPGAYCPVAKQVQIRPGNKALLVTTPTAIQGTPMTLAREAETAVATFKANGECHIGAVDCGV